MVGHCCQHKFEYQRKFKPHLHFDITLKSKTEKESQFLLLFSFCHAFAVLSCTDFLISFLIDFNFNLDVLKCVVITPTPNDLRLKYRKRKLKT